MEQAQSGLTILKFLKLPYSSNIILLLQFLGTIEKYSDN